MSDEISTSEFINKLDVNSLPDNPAAHGMKAADVKKQLLGPIYEGLKRLLAEMQKIDPSAGSGDGSSSSGGSCECNGVSVNIVQSTGNSTTAVMSQAAVTEAINTDVTERVNAFNKVRASAVGLPTYNTSTGVMTFKTLDGGTTKTYDFPIEKIIDNVTLSTDGKSFVFTFHNSDPITLPVDNITLPAWVTDIDGATGEKLLIPPNTEAVKNYITSVKSELESSISNKLNKKPFSTSESGKNVSVGADGSLVATEMPTGVTGESDYKHECNISHSDSLNVYCIVYNDSRDPIGDDFYELGQLVLTGYPCSGTAVNGTVEISTITYLDVEYEGDELINDARFIVEGKYIDSGAAYSQIYYPLTDDNLKFSDIVAEYDIGDLKNKAVTGVSLTSSEDSSGSTQYHLDFRNIKGNCVDLITLPGSSIPGSSITNNIGVINVLGYNSVYVGSSLYFDSDTDLRSGYTVITMTDGWSGMRSIIYYNGLIESITTAGSSYPTAYIELSDNQVYISSVDVPPSAGGCQITIIPNAQAMQATCFLEGTKVETAEGIKNIEDVTEKDRMAFYSWRSKKLCYDQVVIPLATGECTECDRYTFSDGTVLNIYGQDMIYNYDLDKNVSTMEWKVGDRALKNDGSIVTLEDISKVTLDTPKKRYHIITENGCKNAEGIRVGHSKGEVWKYLKRPENAKYLATAPKRIETFKENYRKACLVKTYPYTKEYHEQIAPYFVQRNILSEQIQSRKTYLSDTDYLVVKYMDGALTETEYTPARQKRAETRSEINKLESELLAVEEELDARAKQLRDNYARQVWNN